MKRGTFTRPGIVPVVATLAILAGPASLLGRGTPAQADATKCAHSDASFENCIHVRARGGSGTFVEYVRIGRATSDPNNKPCLGNIKYFVVHKGAQIASGRSDVGSCGIPAVWGTIGVNREFPDGSEVCGIAYDFSGTAYAGQPCAQIHR